MPSRRDQIQSYQFAVQRTVSAMVAGEADPAETPLRRLVGAGFGSIMVGVLALAAVGIFGLVTGRSSAGWREGNAVILERETGAAFVIRDGTLIPAVNFTSALLMQQTPDTVTVSRKDLASMPRGGMVGIPNAPDAIPPASGLLSAGWTICTAAKPTSSGDVGTSTALYVGSTQAGGRGLGDNAVLVKLTTGDGPYLIWHGYRYRINNPALVLEALAMRQEPQTVVGAPWLTALPEGGAIGPLSLDGWGNPVTYISGLPDTRVGQVLVVASAADNKQHYLVEGTRLRPLTELEASLALGDPNARKAYPNVALEARQVSASVANSTPRAPAPAVSAERPPERIPRMVRLARSDASICGTFEPGAALPTVHVDAVSFVGQGLPTPLATIHGVSLVDSVIIAPGRGTIVRAMPSSETDAGALFLVTDLGLRYPLANDAVLGMLGYGSSTPVNLPATVVARLPEGPSLNPELASAPVTPL